MVLSFFAFTSNAFVSLELQFYFVEMDLKYLIMNYWPQFFGIALTKKHINSPSGAFQIYFFY